MIDLLAAATAARERAYAPYSRFKVGAALRGANGGIFVGCNVENAAFPQSQCAEGSAIGAMVVAGETRIVEVLVLGSGDRPCTPCGGCRQSLAEFAAPDVTVWVHAPEGPTLRTTIGELLPYGFTLSEGVAPKSATAAEIIAARAQGFTPVIGLVLGSGLGRIAEAIEPVARIPYTDVPGFPRPSVPGHGGTLILGRLAGVPVACLAGRVHLYEGAPAAAVNVPIRALKALGCKVLLLTNAAGSLRSELTPGSLVLITDHLNLTGTNPLVGCNDETIGPRFPDLSEVYDRELRAILERSAATERIGMASGVYAGLLGPTFETPAEIRALRILGADLVGMSTVPEAISARHCGQRVAAISVVTNAAAGMNVTPLSHVETLRETANASEELKRLLLAAIPELARAAD